MVIFNYHYSPFGDFLLFYFLYIYDYIGRNMKNVIINIERMIYMLFKKLFSKQHANTIDTETDITNSHALIVADEVEISRLIREVATTSVFSKKYFEKTGTVMFVDTSLFQILILEGFGLISMVYTACNGSQTSLNIEYRKNVKMTSNSGSTMLNLTGNAVVDELFMKINGFIATRHDTDPLQINHERRITKS